MKTKLLTPFKLMTLMLLSFLPFFGFSQSLVSISPAIYNAGQTVNLTLIGNQTHFIGNNAYVTFNANSFTGSVTINSTSIVNDTTLIVNITIPKNLCSINFSVYVTDNKDGTLFLNNQNFHVNRITTPSILTISTDSAYVGQTLNVTITGRHTYFTQIQYDTEVNFYSSKKTGIIKTNSITILNDSTLITNITVPLTDITDNYQVFVSDDADAGLQVPVVFKVIKKEKLLPKLISISPNTINAGQTIDVTIKGSLTQFTSEGSIQINSNITNGTLMLNPNKTTIINDSTIIVNLTIPKNAHTADYDVFVYYYIFSNNVSLPSALHVIGQSNIPSLISITPNIANPGQTLNVTIKAKHTNFIADSNYLAISLGTNIEYVMINVNSKKVINDTTIIANITIPQNISSDNIGLSVMDYLMGNINLNGALHIKGDFYFISPNHAQLGQTLNVTFNGDFSQFVLDSNKTQIVFNPEHHYGTIIVNSKSIINDTTILANITIPQNSTIDSYLTIVHNTQANGSIIGFSTVFHVVQTYSVPSVSISPDSVAAGKTLDISIKGKHTYFNDNEQDKSDSYISFEGQNYDGTLTINSMTIISDTVINANITIPQNSNTDIYDFYLTDQADGKLKISNAIYVNSPLLILHSSINEYCNGGLNASIVTITTGGTPPYTYLWSNGATTQNLSTIPAGKYKVTVTDISSISTIDSIIVSEPDSLKLSVTTTPVDTLIPDGSVTINTTGGTPPYSYSIGSTSSLNNTFTNLLAGNYIVSVKDSAGCTATSNVSVGYLIKDSVIIQKDTCILNYTTLPIPNIANLCPVSSYTDILTVNGTGKYKWWTASTGGTAIATGNTFTTPPISKNTTYYVEDTTPVVSYASLKDDSGWPGTPGNKSTNNVPQQNYLNFTANENTTIDSISVAFNFPNLTAGTATATLIDITNGNSQVTKQFNITPPGIGEHFAPIYLGFQLVAGHNYQISIVGTSGSFGTYRYEDNTYTFIKYPVNYGCVTITSGQAVSVYAGLFNWVMNTPSPCTRMPVTAKIDPTCIIKDTIKIQKDTCIIDYTKAVDSTKITSFTVLSQTAISVTLTIYQGGIGKTITSVANYDSTGWNMVSATITCNDGTKALHSNTFYNAIFINPVTTGITNVSKENNTITLFPNPVTGTFQINGIEKNATFTLTDICGKLLLSKEITNDEKIAVNTLPAGIYFVKITTAEGFVVKKLVKE